MARINVDSSTLNAIRNDDIASLLRNMIDLELSKEDEAVNTDFIDECVNALLELEQDEKKGFTVLIPLVSASDYLSRITGKRHWNTLSRGARAAIIAAAFATSTLVVNAAVTGITGVNPLKEASIFLYNTFEDLTSKSSNNEPKQKNVKPTEINNNDKQNNREESEEESDISKTDEITPPTSYNQEKNLNPNDKNSKETEEATKEKEEEKDEKEPVILPAKTEEKAHSQNPREELIVPDNIPENEEENKSNQTPVFSHIEANLKNFKHNYIYGEPLSYEGATVYKVFSDGSREELLLSQCSVTQSLDMHKTADYTLRIIYKTSVIKIPISVRPDEETRYSEIGGNDTFDYLITKNGVYITAYHGSETNLDLSSIDGNNVFAVAAGVFENTDVETISLPNAQKIFENAFKNCKQLKACMTPKARYIGDSAFEGCEKLQNADASNSADYLGKGAFANSGIISITLPSGIVTVPERLCSECAKLKTVNLSSAEIVEKSAFSDCTSLEEVLGTDNLKTVKETAFYGDENAVFETAPSKLENVFTSAFAYCKSVKFGELGKLKSISDYSFMYCSGLTGVTLDNSISVIPQGAFWGTRIKEITLPEGLKRIEAAAFMSTMLKAVTIPESAQYIGARAFQTAGALTVTFLGSPEIEGAAFFNSSRLKIRAYEDSSAITYATENDIDYEIIERS